MGFSVSIGRGLSETATAAVSTVETLTTMQSTPSSRVRSGQTEGFNWRTLLARRYTWRIWSPRWPPRTRAGINSGNSARPSCLTGGWQGRPWRRQGGEREQQLRGAVKAEIQDNKEPQKEISPVFWTGWEDDESSNCPKKKIQRNMKGQPWWLPGLSVLKAEEERGGVFSGYGNNIRPSPT